MLKFGQKIYRYTSIVLHLLGISTLVCPKRLLFFFVIARKGTSRYFALLQFCGVYILLASELSMN